MYVEGSRPDNYSFYYARTMAFQLFLERLFLLYGKLPYISHNTALVEQSAGKFSKISSAQVLCSFRRNKSAGFYYINILHDMDRILCEMHNKIKKERKRKYE